MNKIILFLLVIVFLAGMFIFGFPVLKTYRDRIAYQESISLNFGGDLSLEAARNVTIDITIEDICMNMATGEVLDKCSNKNNCDKTCETEGCKAFGLEYVSSAFTDDKCYCNCVDKDKIKKALNIQE